LSGVRRGELSVMPVRVQVRLQPMAFQGLLNEGQMRRGPQRSEDTRRKAGPSPALDL
jgi:hypothetical protein